MHNHHPHHGRRSIYESQEDGTGIYVFLWGGNDVDNGEIPEVLASMATDVANWAIGSEALAYICSVTPRPTPRYSNPQTFANRAVAYHNALYDEIFNEHRLLYWGLKRMTSAKHPLHSGGPNGGVHLNDQGNERLYHNIRKAVLDGLSRV